MAERNWRRFLWHELPISVMKTWEVIWNRTIHSFLWVAHMEIAMVRSAYRGNGLQKKLMEAAEEQLRSAGFRWLMGTAHPDNVYSVHNFEQLGYKLVTKALKYGGLPRYIFCKKI